MSWRTGADSPGASRRRAARLRPGRALAPDDRGVTLIEAVVSTALLALAAVPIVSLFLAAFLSADTARLTTLATVLAESTLEEARAAGYAGLAAGCGPETPAGDADLPELARFTVQTCVDDLSGGNLRRVTVTVRWSESSGPKALRLVSFVFGSSGGSGP